MFQQKKKKKRITLSWFLKYKTNIVWFFVVVFLHTPAWMDLFNVPKGVLEIFVYESSSSREIVLSFELWTVTGLS